MDIITSLEQHVAAARHVLDGVSADESLPGFLDSLPDNRVLEILEIGVALVRLGQRLEIPASGVVAQRSGRARGHTGIAQARGHRDTVSLLQQLSGVSRAQATREVKIGQSLVEAATASQLGSARSGGLTGGDAQTESEAPTVWHTPLERAADAGAISPDQYTAIRQGLGEPPVPADADVAAVMQVSMEAAARHDARDGDAPDALTEVESFQRVAEIMQHTWTVAATKLLDEASVRSLDELRKACRAVRDELDPVGATMRFADRYAARSFRMWVDDRGVHRAAFTLDDESAAWLKSVIDVVMRPRTGGPRFVTVEEQTAAKELSDDARTNEQLLHDLVIDVLRAGTLARASDVFGVRQVGVRVVRVIDTAGDTNGNGHAFFEHSGSHVPMPVAVRITCNSGIVPIELDRQGDPLNVGREQRLFTTRQRIALSLRDGGCRWQGCDRPANYCEAHHIDEWKADQGRTDVERGILLCRYHHQQVHNQGWRITRNGDGPFFLQKPGSSVARRQTHRGHPPGHTPAVGEVLTREVLGAEVPGSEAPGNGVPSNGVPSIDLPSNEVPVELPVRVIRAYAWGAAPKPSVAFRPGKARPPQPVPPEVWGGRRPSTEATASATATEPPAPAASTG